MKIQVLTRAVSLNQTKTKKIRKSKVSSTKQCPLKRKKSSEMMTDSSLNSHTKSFSNSIEFKQQTPKALPQTDSFYFSQLFYTKLSDLSIKFNLSVSTVRQTFDLLKRYIMKTQLPSIDPDLAMLGSFLIICKFHESWGKVFLEDLVCYCRGKYTHEILIQMEAHILYILDFQVYEQIKPKAKRSARMVIEQ